MRPALSSDLRQSSVFLSTVPGGTLSRFLPGGVPLVHGPLVCKTHGTSPVEFARRRSKPRSPGSCLSGWLSAGLALAQHETQGEEAQLRKRSTWNISGFILAMGGSGIPQDPGVSFSLRRLQVCHVEHSSRNGGDCIYRQWIDRFSHLTPFTGCNAL